MNIQDYNAHLKFSAFEGLRRWREKKRWSESVSRHVEDVRSLRTKRDALQLWFGKYSKNLADRRKIKVVLLWDQNKKRRYFRRWRISAVIITGWMLHLSLCKWRRITRKTLMGRGRIKGRRNRRIKESVMGLLSAHAARGREVLRVRA